MENDDYSMILRYILMQYSSFSARSGQPVATFKCKVHHFKCVFHHFKCRIHQFSCKIHHFKCKIHHVHQTRIDTGSGQPHTTLPKAWDEFRIKSDGILIKSDEIIIKSDEIIIKSDEIYNEMMNFAFKMMNCAFKCSDSQFCVWAKRGWCGDNCGRE